MTATTTVNTASDRRMPGWLKGSLLAAVVVAVCWSGAITYWRATDRVPATADLVLYLLALPLALTMASGFARARIKKPAATPEAPPQPQPAPGINAQPPLVLLAAAIRSPHGESPEELSTAIIDNKARSDLDPELVDDDGFPVMTVRSRDTADEALQEEITEWWNAHGIPQPGLSDHQWRAMTMATAVAGELACAAASDLMPAEGPPPMLQLLPILPQEWHIDQRRAARMWLKHTVAQFGWPPAYIVLADERQETAPAQLGRLATDAVSVAPLAALVVACASNISEDMVAQWSANASLFTSARPHGLIPGEGAAGLLVTDMLQAAALEDVVFTLLNTVAEARRDVSADDARRSDSTLLDALAERALKDGGVKLSDVAMLVADTGHRSNRVLELMGFASGAMPQLDGVDDIVRVGSASGTCGAVPFIMALALGRHHVLERAAPVLCISNEDSYQRCAAVIRPYASA